MGPTDIQFRVCGTMAPVDLSAARRLAADSFYLTDFVSTLLGAVDLDQVYADLWATCPWAPRDHPAMLYRKTLLNRDKAFLVESTAEEAVVDAPPAFMRKYFYPGFQYESMELFYRPIGNVPIVAQLVAALSQLEYRLPGDHEGVWRPVVANNVIATHYNDNDFIGWHHDKTLDIREDSLIIIFTFGARREFHIRDKASHEVEHVVVMEPGSMLVLGWQTNLVKEHSVVPLADERVLPPPDELEPPAGGRISLVMRDIKTVVSLETASRAGAKTRRNRALTAARKALADKL